MYRIACAHEKSPILAVALQEHHITHANNTALNPTAIAHSHGLLLLIAPMPNAEHKGGTALVIPYGSIEMRGKETLDDAKARIRNSAHYRPDGRLVTAATLHEGTFITLASAYAPNTDAARPTFLRQIRRALNGSTVLGIDANCVIDTELDVARNATTPYRNIGTAELASIIADHDLTDIARENLGPTTPFFTNHTVVETGPNGRPTAITKTRIDLILTFNLDAKMWSHAAATDFLRFRRTYGHDMIQADLAPIRDAKGADLQTVNERIYDDLAFNNQLAKDIIRTRDTQRAGGTDWRGTWEAIKSHIMKASLEQTLKIKRTESAEYRANKKKLDIIDSTINSGTAGPSAYEKREAIREEMSKQRHSNATLASRLEFDASIHGKNHDANTAAFHRRWTPRNAAQWVKELIVGDWSNPSAPILTNPPQKETSAAKIADAFTAYYKALFAHKPTTRGAREAALRTLRKGNRVLPPTAQRCDENITVDEVLHVSAYLPAGKSPGPDRIPNQFYRSFAEIIAPILTAVFEESRDVGALPPSMLEGIISVLYKKKEREDPRNYRPITLLNGDYKIMMRILTARMNEAVMQFVSRDQNGFVPNSFIAENLLRLQLLQDLIESEDQEAIYLFIDMEKAFDRCSWRFMKDGLEAIGFGADFIKFVSLAYSDETPPQRQMYVNGYLGAPFALSSGVAQGCPLSPLLFLIIAEPLARLINDNPLIEGVKAGATAHKISQFADDTTLIMRPWDVVHCLAMLKIWQRATSMKENDAKREVLLLGSLRRNPTRVPRELLRNGVRPAPDGATIRALGVPIGNDFSNEGWWDTKYAEVKARVGHWTGLGRLSLPGRNILLQSILYGCLRYWFFTLPVPVGLEMMIESDAKELLWAASPALQTNEKGTNTKANRHMTEAASYLPTKKGLPTIGAPHR